MFDVVRLSLKQDVDVLHSYERHTCTAAQHVYGQHNIEILIEMLSNNIIIIFY